MADQTPLQIGNVLIENMDAPEIIGDFGSTQKASVSKFSGGLITAQLMGRFPKPITFKQTLRGAQARTKAYAIDQLTDAGAVTVSFDAFTSYGFVEEVKIHPLNNGEYEYELTFQPVQRNTPQSGGTTPSSQDLLNNSLAVANQQANKPITAYQFNGTIPAQTSQLQQNVSQALNQNQNNLANLPTSTRNSLLGQITQIRQQLQPIINGGSSQAVSAASDLDTSLNVARLALRPSVPLQQQLNVTNPNLFQLAAQYYNDPLKFYLIAQANDLYDTQPIGQFQLSIPQDPNASVSEPPTLL
ncbi:MAG TPA: hypothetical protein V6C76_11775 [Drouetiella sp.]